jgi:hypothetical protein
VRLNRAAVDHRRFWDPMDRLGEGQLREIETRLSRHLVTEFGLDPTGWRWTWPNFATFIDTQAKLVPTRSQLADTLGGGGLSI